MPDKPTDLFQGTLDMFILKALALEPMHGYGNRYPNRTDEQKRFSR